MIKFATVTTNKHGPIQFDRFRKWAVRVGIALLLVEIFYVIAANILIRRDLLTQLVNKKPEKTHISWDSAVTYLPGFVTVTGFTLRSQTMRNQVYVHVAEADARISLIKLAFKTIHVRGVDAREVDFRYRQRLDRPPKEGQEEEPLEPQEVVDYYPEIPGFTNPPDPKPEDLYPRKKKKRPWTIKITGADVEGPVRLALNEIRIEGDGSVGGGVTVKPRKTITIHSGRLGLDRTTITIGPEVVTENLAINSDLHFETFPAKGAKFADVLGGISGILLLAGQLSEKASVSQEITPGITTFGAGIIAANLKFKDGVLRAGSQYSLQSDAFHVRIMELDATGSATISGDTVKESGKHVTRTRVVLGDFEFVDPDNEANEISGTGLALSAQWNGFSLGDYVPASHVEVTVPPTQINDVSIFNGLIPGGSTLAFQSGTGEVEARLEVNDRIAVGTLDLVAEDIVLKTKEMPMYGDLELHANLAEGDLPNRKFDISKTTIRLDDVVGEELSQKQEKKREAWYCDVELQRGTVTIGKPLEAEGQVRLKMYDTRPVVGTLKDFGTGPKWLSMLPNVKDIEGTMDVAFGKGRMAVDDLELTGNKLEVLGWLHILDKKADGRLFMKYGIMAAGIALDQGQGKVHISKPRKWFEEQQVPPQEDGQLATADDS
jgi:hypothetical protein